MPAVIATAPSAPIKASESQESRRALRAAACHSGLRIRTPGWTTVSSRAAVVIEGPRLRCACDDRREQCAPSVRQRVEHHLPVAPRVHEPGGAQGAQIVRDEILKTLGDPARSQRTAHPPARAPPQA
jgi:hypothetical protein